VSGLLAALVRQEVENMPRSVYHLSQAMQNAGAEPLSYNHLPDHSVLRSEGSHNFCLLSCNSFLAKIYDAYILFLSAFLLMASALKP
jgi:hypothetical protein